MEPNNLLRRKPTSKIFYISICIAFFGNLIPTTKFFPWPDFLAVLFVFWNIYTPGKINLFFAWFMGIIMDVYTGAFLGQHALLYSILCFTTNMFQRRLSWYTLINQCINLLPIFAFALFIDAIVRYAADGTTAPWWFVFRPVLESITAFLIGWIMLKLINRRSGSALTARPSSSRIKI
ncbi:rod shape-determining protein MreD [Betaproteobacteria bacterium]|nr:rod shape-determining protein MreD [Betaproteobacteria bacterium]